VTTPRHIEEACERLALRGLGVKVTPPAQGGWKITAWQNGIEHRFQYTKDGQFLGAYDPEPHLLPLVHSPTLGDVVARWLS
jgi:hypothetical protein